MRIGIEAQRIFRQKKHGMDYVVLQEILEIQKIDHKNEYFIFVKPGPDRCVKDSRNVHVIEINCPSYPLWEQWALPKAVEECDVELLHCTSNTAPIFCSVPMILTLHDIIFLEPRDKNNKNIYQNLGWLYRRYVVPRILKKCKKIITVSDFERINIIRKLQLPADQIVMIYNGYNEWFKPLEDKQEVYKKYIGEKGYFFFLGNTDPKKNSERTIVAYAHYLEKSTIKRKLLLADLAPQYLNDILQRNHIENIKKYIVSPGYIVNSDLPYVYNAAFGFLYTSLRESFGIPLLEAMACGTPVITSNTSSMPEIAGSNGCFVNPEDASDIAANMLKLENDSNYYEQLREFGLKRAPYFSWKHTAEDLLALYEDIVNDDMEY
jgi:glycosyltransferase involved in cell wall biosynthesis